ncbi:MAG TPA: hypothetical protein GX534_08060 [Thermoanaerobacterales bacterium]|nr:hypothetical protein [Thermoanaerobacterales bacterium]
MNYLIVTNNPSVKQHFKSASYHDCSTLDILIKTRNLLHQGFSLVTHPLCANVKMMCSPFKSIVVAKNQKNNEVMSLEIIESSILKLGKHLKQKGLDYLNEDDYKKLDLWFLKTALDELNIV